MGFVPEAFHKALIADIGRTKQPTDASSPQHWAAFMLQTNVTKKYNDGTTNAQAESAALEKFRSVNAKVSEWQLPPEGSDAIRILKRAKELFRQHYFDNEGIPRWTVSHAYNTGMVGPGAAIDATSHFLGDKMFNSVLTCTDPILYKYYVQAIAGSKNWWKAERARTFQHVKYRIVKGNKLFYVPKETIIARTAATEPTLNMFGQLGYGKIIENVLQRHHDINLSVQPNINKWLAKSGSSSGEYATIDLSSASDTIGLGLLEWLLPERLLRDLKLLRSPVTLVGNEQIHLNMISTMGNGFTFPLETWIFANLVLAVMIDTNEPVFDVYGKRRYSVFGDDIICPSRVYDNVTSTLEAAGFSVNRRKSFGTGKFRESCGGDYFDGRNVRAVYLKECTHDSHVYGLINRLLDWSGIHKIPLPNTIRYLTTLVRFRPIPLYEDEQSGIRVPLARLTGRKISKRGHFIYHSLQREVDRVVPELRSIEKFYHAFHVALLHGSFRGGAVTPRALPGDARYKVVKREAPVFWDFSTDARLTTEERRNAFELNYPIRTA